MTRQHRFLWHFCIRTPELFENQRSLYQQTFLSGVFTSGPKEELLIHLCPSLLLHLVSSTEARTERPRTLSGFAVGEACEAEAGGGVCGGLAAEVAPEAESAAEKRPDSA